MREPGFFDLVVLGAPGQARWLILTDLNPPSAPNRLAQVEPDRPADSIAAAVRRNYAFQDGTVSTFVKQGAGRAGLMLRMAGEKDFLVLLVDAASGEAVLSSYRDGKRPSSGGAARSSSARGRRSRCRPPEPTLVGLLQRREALRGDGSAPRRRAGPGSPRRARARPRSTSSSSSRAAGKRPD